MHSEEGFQAAIDWLSSGQNGPFGERLAALALQCDAQQLSLLLTAFSKEFNRASDLAQLYDWADIPFAKSIESASFMKTNEFR
jgi:hypothetical protein